jgi:hypothetical protein
MKDSPTILIKQAAMLRKPHGKEPWMPPANSQKEASALNHTHQNINSANNPNEL